MYKTVRPIRVYSKFHGRGFGGSGHSYTLPAETLVEIEEDSGDPQDTIVILASGAIPGPKFLDGRAEVERDAVELTGTTHLVMHTRSPEAMCGQTRVDAPADHAFVVARLWHDWSFPTLCYACAQEWITKFVK